MSGAPPPQPGTAGTDDDPLDIETDVLELLNTTAGVATVENLVGVAADSTSTDGTLVYPTANGAQGVPTDLAVRIDGVDRPVTAIEYADATGTLRPVTQWHLGPLGEFTLTLDSLTFVQPATFDVGIASTTSPVAPGDTLDVTVDVTNTGNETGTQTVTLDIGGVGQVDSQGVPLTGGQSSTTTLSWSVPSGQSEQDYVATVSSVDDTASQTVTVGGIIIEDWERSNPLSNYTISTTNNATESIQNSVVDTGSNALELRAEHTSDFSQISAEANSISNLPTAGDTIKYRVRTTNNEQGFTGVRWGVSGGDYYEAHFDTRGTDFEVVDSSSGLLASDTNVTIPVNEWMTYTVDWGSGGSQTVTVTGDSSGTVASVSFNNSARTSGGIGFRKSIFFESNGDVSKGYFDSVTIS